MALVKLGLIGANIAHSKAPLLHRLAGRLSGVEVRYDRLVPEQLGRRFDEVFEDCARSGYRGVNVTYPYKELAARRVRIDDPLVRGIGAVNTVVFETDGARGYNTDYSGFIAAYRSILGPADPGRVCLIGAGGAGKAVAFGLLALGLGELSLVDTNQHKAAALAEKLRGTRSGLRVQVFAEAERAARGAVGLVNCTPVGMVGHEGTPLPASAMVGARWAFDAVYTPEDTRFLRDADRAGLRVLSGYELFFQQGVHAWDIFVGAPLAQEALRKALREP